MKIIVGFLIVFVHQYFFAVGQERSYYFSAPQTHFQQNFGQNGLTHTQGFGKFPAGFEHLNSYLAHPDLDTSDLSSHLRRTLPQYQVGYFENPVNPLKFQVRPNTEDPLSLNSASRSLAKRTSFPQQIAPSTHRPNYSHLFSKTSHNHHNPQTETFLGQITIQSPADLPKPFDSRGFQPSTNFGYNNINQLTPPESDSYTNFEKFRTDKLTDKTFKFPPIVKQHLDIPGNPTVNNSYGASNNEFLNHRTRIFAPELGNVVKTNNYFVNSNGDVFDNFKSTTAIPITTLNRKHYVTPTVPITTLDRKHHFDVTSSVPITTLGRKHNVNITPSVPITTFDRKLHTFTYPSTITPPTTPQQTRTFENTFNLDSLLEAPLQKRHQPSSNDNVEIVQPITISPDQFYTIKLPEDSSEPETTIDEFEYESIESHTPSIEKQEFHKFEKHVSNDTSLPDTKNDNTNNQLFDVLTTKPSPMVKDDKFSKFIDSSEIDVSAEKQLPNPVGHRMPKLNKMLDHAVISVVTTRSIINNTMIGNPSTLKLKVTQNMVPAEKNEHVTHGTDEETSTEGWVVVASVQTSRSVSGARYLPFAVVEQYERTKLLNEPLPPIIKEEQKATTSTPLESDTLPPNDKINSSTESLIDKLDRVQSDLSSDVLTDGFNNGANHIAVITEKNIDRGVETTTTSPTTQKNTPSSYAPVVIRKFSPHVRPSTARPKFKLKPQIGKTQNKQFDTVKLQADQPQVQLTTESHVTKDQLNHSTKSIESLLSKIKFQDNSNFLPADYKEKQHNISNSDDTQPSDVFASILKKATPVEISSLLPADYKNMENKEKPQVANILKKSKTDNVSAFLPPGYKQSDNTKNTSTSISDNSPSDLVTSILKKAKQNDISAFLPADYKATHTTSKPSTASTSKSINSILTNSQNVDISALLPPGYKLPRVPSTTKQPKAIDDIFENTKEEDILALLPVGYKSRFSPVKPTTESAAKTSSEVQTTKSAGNFKIVFPSRPGGTTKKINRLTTPTPTDEEVVAPISPLQPVIHKGWPTRATTEFTGWPTPSTTPISIEKLLEAARAAATSVSTTTTSTTASTTTVTTTSTTTPKPTTPGMCVSECDLAGTIKLTKGVKWSPELLDRNTREWQLLANEVQYQLEDVFTKSEMFGKWYKTIRIDGFSEGSVLVDYVVELNNVTQQIDTRELKGLFNNALTDAFVKSSPIREAKASDLDKDHAMDGKLTLGNFIIDPTYTDFVVLPKRALPTVGYAEEVFLPQWAIAIIVIGLASLLFVIIFGVTVLINKQKNAKKKQPSTLTEEMLSELNKNHMGGIDNYAADDLYNMDDVWNENPYDTKLPKKRSAGSIHETSMPNIYDSWKSEWNGYYYNTHYSNHHPGGSQVGYGRRRSDYDTNF